jgi:hypothetical protein
VRDWLVAFARGASEGTDLDTVGQQQGGCDPWPRRQTTGRAAGFQKTTPDLLRQGDAQNHGSAADEWLRKVVAVPVDNLSRTGKDAIPVAIEQVGRRTGRGQTAKLFGQTGIQ